MKNSNPNFASSALTTPSDWKPTTGYAVGGGIQVPVWDDFFLTPQSSTRSLGAIIP